MLEKVLSKRVKDGRRHLQIDPKEICEAPDFKGYVACIVNPNGALVVSAQGDTIDEALTALRELCEEPDSSEW